MAWNIQMPEGRWITSDDPRLESIIREVLDTEYVAIDTETTGLNLITDIPLYWSLCWGENRYCLPASTLPYFSESFRDPKKKWIFCNAKFDIHMLANVGIHFAGMVFDTCVMHALINEEKPHGLEYMSKDVLGWTWKADGGFKTAVDMQKIKNEEGKKVWESAGDALRRLEATNPTKLVDYASNDAYGTFKVFQALKPQLEATNVWSLWPNLYPTMWDIFLKNEAPFTKILWKCERKGMKIDADYLQRITDPIEKDLAQIERDITQMVGRVINLRSPDQMRQYYIDECRLKPRMMTKGGKSGNRKASVDATFLEYYATENLVAGKHLDYRELDKILGTYIKGLLKHLDYQSRVHPRSNQDVARTGRLSSSEPNCHNTPRPDEDKYKIRGAFVPDKGKKLLVSDYDCLEMRLLAAASGEEKMIQIFKSGRDIHMSNAEVVFGKKHGVTYEEIVAAKKIDKEVKAGKRPASDLTERVQLCLFLRQATKSTGYGLNYGMKEKKLARQIGRPVEEAKEIMDLYAKSLPAVSQFYKDAIKRTRDTGYSFSVLGKRRFLPEIISDHELDRFQAERQAVNNEIQGSAANIAQMAMLRIDEENLEERFGCEMLIQVHDELVFECPTETIEQVKPIIKHWMEHPLPTDLAVELPISMGVGDNWASAK